ncbi:hypothetical protein R1flu_028771 [Riccia fluitans]|uniref:ATP-dependent Clp protease proteolytic subunit n=1 Tax=Riccia fluitans TaxID=41844 RepID=A0ABD1XRP6_9MARC
MEALAFAGARCPSALVSSTRCRGRVEQSAIASFSTLPLLPPRQFLFSGLRAVSKDRFYKQATSFQGKVQKSPNSVPYRIPQESLCSQWVHIWNVLYRERIIFVGQYIDEEFRNQFLATMLYLDSSDNTKPLYLYLNSLGGDGLHNDAHDKDSVSVAVRPMRFKMKRRSCLGLYLAKYLRRLDSPSKKQVSKDCKSYQTI